jgi:2-oxoglutarate ferredoxin oxidoreductase subunit delta
MPNIIIDVERCKGCSLCTDACPRKLIVIGTVPNSQGYFTAVYEDTDKKCTGCALCAEMCPDVAIEVYK